MQVTADVDLDLDCSVHPDNAIRVCYTGARASQATTLMLQRAVAELVNARITPTPPLTAKELSVHYKMDDTQTVFFQLPQRVEATAVFGLDGETTQKLSIRIARPDYEDTRVFLNYCPPNLNDQQLAKLARKVMSPEQVKHSTMYKRVQGRRDRHLIIAPLTPEQIAEVPHYIRYKARGIQKTIHVTMPGRKPVCPRCEQGEHRPSDCKTKSKTTAETAPKKRKLNSSATQTENAIELSTSETQTSEVHDPDETIIMQSNLDATFEAQTSRVSEASATSTPRKSKHTVDHTAFIRLDSSFSKLKPGYSIIVGAEEDETKRTVAYEVVETTMYLEAVKCPTTTDSEKPRFKPYNREQELKDVPPGSIIFASQKKDPKTTFFILVALQQVGEEQNHKYVIQTKKQVYGPEGHQRHYIDDLWGERMKNSPLPLDNVNPL